MKTLKVVAGVLMLISSLFLFNFNIVSAFFLFFAGLICTPWTLQFIENLIKLKFPSFLKYLIVILFFCISVSNTNQDKINTTPNLKKELTIKEQVESNPNSFLIIEQKGWTDGGFGAVGIQNFNIKNTSPYPMKDIKLRFVYIGESGTELSENIETVYKIVKPKSTLKVRDFNAGFKHSQATSCRIEIMRVTPML
jgi:hypothetical protein